jgi:hypothetical protein
MKILWLRNPVICWHEVVMHCIHCDHMCLLLQSLRSHVPFTAVIAITCLFDVACVCRHSSRRAPSSTVSTQQTCGWCTRLSGRQRSDRRARGSCASRQVTVYSFQLKSGQSLSKRGCPRLHPCLLEHALMREIFKADK